MGFAPAPFWYATGDLVERAGLGLRLRRTRARRVREGRTRREDLPRRAIAARYANLGAPVIHIEWYPLREEPGLGALIYLDEGQGARRQRCTVRDRSTPAPQRPAPAGGAPRVVPGRARRIRSAPFHHRALRLPAGTASRDRQGQRGGRDDRAAPPRAPGCAAGQGRQAPRHRPHRSRPAAPVELDARVRALAWAGCFTCCDSTSTTSAAEATV